MEFSGNGGTNSAPIVSLLEISRVLDETARLLRQHVPSIDVPPHSADAVGPMASAALVRTILALRRRRRDFFPIADGDDAWSMLLELYAARLERRRLYQTKLGVASGVAQTTAFRITRKFLATGLCVSGRDPDDGRLVLIELSDSAAERMRDYLEAGGGIGALLA